MKNVGAKAALAVAVTAALCATGSTYAVAAGKPVNACELLTLDEISAVMGAKVGLGDLKEAPSGQDDAFASTCVWRLAKPEGQENANLPLQGKSYAILNVISWPDTKGAAHYLQSFWEAGEAGTIPHKPIAVKVGDDALFWGDGVAARKGNVSFGVSVHLPGGNPQQQAMEVDLAKKVIPRL